MAVAGLTCRGSYAGSGRTPSPETPKLVEAPYLRGPRKVLGSTGYEFGPCRHTIRGT